MRVLLLCVRTWTMKCSKTTFLSPSCSVDATTAAHKKPSRLKFNINIHPCLSQSILPTIAKSVFPNPHSPHPITTTTNTNNNNARESTPRRPATQRNLHPKPRLCLGLRRVPVPAQLEMLPLQIHNPPFHRQRGPTAWLRCQ